MVAAGHRFQRPARPGRGRAPWIHADLSTVVDLAVGPLFASALFVLGPGRHLWYLRAHHIAVDGYAVGLLAEQVAHLYATSPQTGRGFGRLRAVVEADLAYQDSADRARDAAWWRARLADLPDPARLSARAATPSGRVLRHEAGLLPAQAWRAWQAEGERYGVTWAEIVLARIAAYVAERADVPEVMLGVPMMGRLGTPAARTPAMIQNVVPVRVRVGGGLGQVARGVAAELRAVRAHQRYRSEDLRRDLGLVGGGRALYGPIVNLMPLSSVLAFGPDVRAVARNIAAGGLWVEDLVVHLHRDPPRLALDANAAGYRRHELEAYAQHLREALHPARACAA